MGESQEPIERPLSVLVESNVVEENVPSFVVVPQNIPHSLGRFRGNSGPTLRTKKGGRM